jgi:hypothetical protein
MMYVVASPEGEAYEPPTSATEGRDVTGGDSEGARGLR